jgi:hypothetical protein
MRGDYVIQVNFRLRGGRIIKKNDSKETSDEDEFEDDGEFERDESVDEDINIDEMLMPSEEEVDNFDFSENDR